MGTWGQVPLTRNCKDPEVLRYKKILTENVLYRLLAPFLDLKTNDWNVGKKQLIDRINAYYRLIYKFDRLDGLNTRIYFDERWSEYIIRNQVIIKGWLKYNLVEYLQRRNPNVPGVIDKLYPPQERKLEDIQKYWKLLMTVGPVVEGRLYAPNLTRDEFANRLSEIVLPVYQSAKSAGFREWEYTAN